MRRALLLAAAPGPAGDLLAGQRRGGRRRGLGLGPGPRARLDRAPVPRAARDDALRLPAGPGHAVLHGQPGGQQDGRRRQRAAVSDLAGRADPACRRPGVGAAPAGPRCGGRHLLRRRRVVGGRCPRGDEPRRRAPGPGRLRAEEQRLGHLHPRAQADRHGELRRPRRRLRHGRRARRRQRPLRDARRLLAGGRAGAGGGGTDADRGPHLPHGPAQHLRRSDALRRPRRARGAPRLRSDRARAPLPDRRGVDRRGLRAAPGRRAACRCRRRVRRGAGEPGTRLGRDLRPRLRAGARAPATPSAGRRRGRPADGRDDDDRGDPLHPGRCSGARRARDRARPGRRRQRRGLPRHGGPAGALRRRSRGRHAAGRGGHRRLGRRTGVQRDDPDPRAAVPGLRQPGLPPDRGPGRALQLPLAGLLSDADGHPRAIRRQRAHARAALRQP